MAAPPRSVTETTARPLQEPRLRGFWRNVSQGETSFAYLLLLPALVILAIFMLYPFVLRIWLSLTNARIGTAGHFIGLRNFQLLLDDSVFRQTVQNTFVYTFSTMVFKLVLGVAMDRADRTQRSGLIHALRFQLQPD